MTQEQYNRAVEIDKQLWELKKERSNVNEICEQRRAYLNKACNDEYNKDWFKEVVFKQLEILNSATLSEVDDKINKLKKEIEEL